LTLAAMRSQPASMKTTIQRVIPDHKVTGSDVSGWQRLKGCDWPHARAFGDSFAFVKLSQGLKISRKGLKHVERLKPSGMPWGGYHFADPRGKGKVQPNEQADTLARGLERSGGLLAGNVKPVLDMEWISFGRTKEGKARGKQFRRQFPAAAVMDWTDAFAERLEQNVGAVPMIYTGRSFVKYRFRRSIRLSKYDLWLAAYVDVGPERDYTPSLHEGPRPVLLESGYQWQPLIWQWTGRGSAAWYRKGRGKIDRNLFMGAPEDFQRWLVDGDLTQGG